MKLQKTLLIASVLIGGFVATASAQIVLINQNFDSAFATSQGLGGGWNGGDSTSFSSGVVTGVGTGGSSALEIVNNTANNGNGYALATAQYQEMTISGNTSANLSDYTISFDAKASAGSLQFMIQTWPGQYFGGTLSGTLATFPDPPGYGNDLALNSTYTHYSLNLSDSGIFHSGTIDPTGATWQIEFQLNGGANGDPSQLTLDVDNLQLTMVPEPTTFALAGLGMATWLIFRRRRV